jgi:DNA invertase Pin-like site-specific DNA recombinase
MLLSGRLSPYENLGSASGRLQLAILAALSQFERERLKERTVAASHGLERRASALDVPWSRCPLGSSNP